MPRAAEAYRIHFEIQYVGRTIKHAKRRVTFKFAFEGDSDEHSVVLMHTVNSGKKVVFLNGNEIFEEENVRDERLGCTSPRTAATGPSLRSAQQVALPAWPPSSLPAALPARSCP
jgi:hypothetical protein